ncbi:39_t:CDS:1, partial [Gigaspora rosea]
LHVLLLKHKDKHLFVASPLYSSYYLQDDVEAPYKSHRSHF